MSRLLWNGERIKALLEEKGITQAELADMMNEFIRIHDLKKRTKLNDNLKQQYIARWVNNTQEPNPHYVAIIASVLGVDVNYLVGLSDNPISSTSLTDSEIKLIKAKRENDYRTLINLISEE